MSTVRPVIFHDQEPLKHELYGPKVVSECETQHITQHLGINVNGPWLQYIQNLNLRAVRPDNEYLTWTIVHSEQNSPEVEWYRHQGWSTVHYWSHGLIAREWYRYAQHDPAVRDYSQQFDYDWLIYNRSWSGTREYRLKFTERMIDNGLRVNSLMRFNVDDSGHYTDHQFVNPKFSLSKHDLEQHFPACDVDSDASADYDANNYQQCAIEVILETMFDDPRIHLTEKTLRPIACGKPFLLLAGPGSLDYLKYYGFDTFDDVIDTSYDHIQDSDQRMQAVMAEMMHISQAPDKSRIIRELHRRAVANQNHFFSDKFTDTILDEFRSGMHMSRQDLKKQTRQQFQDLYQRLYDTDSNIFEAVKKLDYDWYELMRSRWV